MVYNWIYFKIFDTIFKYIPMKKKNYKIRTQVYKIQILSTGLKIINISCTFFVKDTTIHVLLLNNISTTFDHLTYLISECIKLKLFLKDFYFVISFT